MWHGAQGQDTDKGRRTRHRRHRTQDRRRDGDRAGDAVQGVQTGAEVRRTAARIDTRHGVRMHRYTYDYIVMRCGWESNKWYVKLHKTGVWLFEKEGVKPLVNLWNLNVKAKTLFD